MRLYEVEYAGYKFPCLTAIEVRNMLERIRKVQPE